mmetsp:Transcript_76995/g.249138  ORF Transcript_76995/g.249138 Transcript_76995/m.249138 type:complete len:419 (-) Transcript_76995:53-1309(-)
MVGQTSGPSSSSAAPSPWLPLALPGESEPLPAPSPPCSSSAPGVAWGVLLPRAFSGSLPLGCSRFPRVFRRRNPLALPFATGAAKDLRPSPSTVLRRASSLCLPELLEASSSVPSSSFSSCSTSSLPFHAVVRCAVQLADLALTAAAPTLTELTLFREVGRGVAFVPSTLLPERRVSGGMIAASSPPRAVRVPGAGSAVGCAPLDLRETLRKTVVFASATRLHLLCATGTSPESRRAVSTMFVCSRKCMSSSRWSFSAGNSSKASSNTKRVSVKALTSPTARTVAVRWEHLPSSTGSPMRLPAFTSPTLTPPTSTMPEPRCMRSAKSPSSPCWSMTSSAEYTTFSMPWAMNSKKLGSLVLKNFSRKTRLGLSSLSSPSAAQLLTLLKVLPGRSWSTLGVADLEAHGLPVGSSMFWCDK